MQNNIESMAKMFTAHFTQNDIHQLIHLLQFQSSKPEKSVYLADYLQNFWDWNCSQYLKERKMQGITIHKRYVQRKLGTVRNYWIPYFGKSKTLQSLSKQELKQFALSFLDKKQPSSSKGKNDVLRSGTIALQWAYQNDLINNDITKGLLFFSSSEPEHKILDILDVNRLFSRPWNNQVAELANKTAMITGLRAGELQGLRQCDIGDDCLYVNHSWNCADGLKEPKNGEKRTVYIPFQHIMYELRKQAFSNPHTKDGFGYVFYSGVPHSPMDGKYWLKELRKELTNIGFSKEAAKKIRFHAWRHFYATHMRNSGQISDRLLQRVTGHKTLSMLDHYSNHRLSIDENSLKTATKTVFSNFLQENVV